VSNRDVPDRDFDPSSFDDILELVSSWTIYRSMTASEIVDRLRARGVLVRATSSGRHVIVESPRANAGDPPDARRFVVPNAREAIGDWVAHRIDAPTDQPRVLRPPGQALHLVASLFGKRTRERILDPIIADMQLEYCDTLAERPSRMRLWLVQARAWVAFTEAIVLRTVIGRLIKGLAGLTRG
jgi:hypothetical protein